MSCERYILDANGRAVPCPDLLKWAKWFSSGNREEFQFHDEVEGYNISTVFLGLDHSFNQGPPVLWESMVFNKEMSSMLKDDMAELSKAAKIYKETGVWPEMPPPYGGKTDPLHQHMDRCAGGIEQAEAMHMRMVEHVKNKLSVKEHSNAKDKPTNTDDV